MRRIKYALAALAIFIMAFAFAGCGVEISDQSPFYTNYDDSMNFEVSEMVVVMDVKENRTVEVSEKISVVFKTLRQGIYRDIPVNSGEKIRDLTVENDLFSVKHDGDLVSVKIGGDRYYGRNDTHTYNIKYTYVIPQIKDLPDTFYMNVIGQGWATTIDKAKVVINFPAEIGEQSYYVGRYGTISGGNRLTKTYSNDNKSVTLETTDLKSFEGVTAAIDLPENTLKMYVDNSMWITIAIAVAVAVIAILLKLKFGKSADLTPVVNFYPPKNKDGAEMTPAEMGCLIDQSCSDTDVTSMIFYWASKGYLTVEETDDKDDMIITKVKDLNLDAKSFEIEMFNKLFKKGNKVTTKSLKNSFYTTITNVKTKVKAEHSGKMFSSKVFTLSIITAALAVLAFGLGVFLSYFRISRGYLQPFGFLYVAFAAVVFIAGLTLAQHYQKFTPSRRKAILLGYFIGFMLLSLISTAIIAPDAMNLVERIVLALGCTFAAVIAPFIVRRTKTYDDQLNQILGFRNFIRDVEKDRLEMMLQDNPQYYYDILPYANVLGVSDIWEDKFKALTIEPPSYYGGRNYSLFDFMVFNAFYRSAFRNFTVNAVSRPSASSSSGFGSGGGGFRGGGGGGGFSGGGFGGGGGRSW